MKVAEMVSKLAKAAFMRFAGTVTEGKFLGRD
jgi:hypothetical protein